MSFPSDNVGAFFPALILMGVSGAGKTTIGKQLAVASGDIFEDGDDYHDATSIRKMSAGDALTDQDRQGWLARLTSLIHDKKRKERLILACSALKHDYQSTLCNGPAHVLLVFLEVSHEELNRRLNCRKGHFMSSVLLDSQLKTLEPPPICMQPLLESPHSKGIGHAQPTVLRLNANAPPAESCARLLPIWQTFE